MSLKYMAQPPSFFLSFPGRLTKQQIEDLRRAWAEQYSGLQNRTWVVVDALKIICHPTTTVGKIGNFVSLDWRRQRRIHAVQLVMIAVIVVVLGWMML